MSLIVNIQVWFLMSAFSSLLESSWVNLSLNINPFQAYPYYFQMDLINNIFCFVFWLLEITARRQQLGCTETTWHHHRNWFLSIVTCISIRHPKIKFVEISPMWPVLVNTSFIFHWVYQDMAFVETTRILREILLEEIDTCWVTANLTLLQRCEYFGKKTTLPIFLYFHYEKGVSLVFLYS